MASKRAIASAARQLRACSTLSASALRPLPQTISRPTQKSAIFSTRPFSTSTHLLKEAPPKNSSGIPPSTVYTFADIQNLSSCAPDTKRILIDVREPSELLASGTIPSSINIPISSAPDAFFLPPEEFEDRYGFERPASDTEVVFFCKAGVRSRQAARLAGQASFGGKVGEFPGSWNAWVENGGKVEHVK